MINYKGYIGQFTFDDTKNIFCGRVANTHDLIIFQGKSIKETQEAFQNAINEQSGVRNMAKSLKNPSLWSKYFQKKRIDCHEHKNKIN